jgi:tRNA-2-methylthio-N6-dimethylallyladenosine synthase
MSGESNRERRDSSRTFFIGTYGCQMNDLDSEMMEGMLAARGWMRTVNEAEADVIIVNTCCVRRSAEERAIGRITRLKPLKRRRNGRVICIAGCIAQREGKRLLEKMPFVDLVVGTRDYVQLPQLLDEVESFGARIAATDGIDAPMRFEAAARPRRALKAIVTIMYGCNNFCAYCVVPYVRGREVSRPRSEILDEIRHLVANGCKEVLLVGQNVNSYRDGSWDFSALLAAVNDVDGLQRIRFITSHPKDVSEALIEAVASLPKVCEHVHLPAQAGNNRVLEAMNRKYGREDYLLLVQKIRQRIPQVTLTTDLMVGFPGETEEEFADTLDLVERVRWDAAFMFMYSVRPGTAASKLADTVSAARKQERLAQLIKRQEEISAEKNRDLVATIQEVLVEGESRRSARELMGRTRGDKVVIFEGGTEMCGSLVRVKITQGAAHTLFGECL